MADIDADTLLDMSHGVFAEIAKIERLMSFHDPDSELSHINREAARGGCAISDDMAAVLKTALTISALSGGRYDLSIAPELIKKGLLPNVEQARNEGSDWRDICLVDNRLSFAQPMLLDLGGIAKGYAVDKAFAVICNQVDDVMINAGGDLRMKQWQGQRVAVKTPSGGESATVNLPMQDAALATTANYYFAKGESAIIDPQAKQVVSDDRSISVFAPSCVVADALTKVVLLAENAIEVVKSMQASAVLIAQDGTVNNLF